MERAPLRQVPWGPPETATRPDAAPALEPLGYVLEKLPGLDGPAASALAQVALGGRSRADVEGLSGEGLSGEELAGALTRARKALRRKAYPLPGSGWCERAERLISDRVDGALEPPGPARLDVHLANCPRCVEHELRLGQCQDALLAGFADLEPREESEVSTREAESPAPPNLRVVSAPALPAAPPPHLLPTAPAPQALPVAPPAQPPPAAAPALASPPRALPPAAPATSSPTIHSGSWADVAPGARAQAWERPRPALSSRTASAAEDSTWVAIGPLLAVLLVTVLVFLLAGVLTYV